MRNDGYITVYFACINAPGVTKKAAGKHTVGSYAYGNGAGYRWGEALRPHTCPHCGSQVVTGFSRSSLARNMEYERSRQQQDTGRPTGKLVP